MLKVFNYLKSHFLYLGYDRKVFKNIIPKIDEYNLHNMHVFPLLAAVFFGTLTFFTFIFDYMWQYFPTYLFGFGMSLISRLLVRFANKNRLVLDVSMGIFIMSLFSFGVLSGTMYGMERNASSFSALLMAAPLLFCAKPIFILAGVTLSDIVFIQFAILFKEPNIRNDDIISVVAFSVVSIIISTVINKGRVKRFLLEKELDYARQIDDMTTLRNRNSYENRIQKITSSKLPKVSCIFVDVNGLHDLNNSKGHEAGDKMLKDIAVLFKEYYDERYAYRIGGDEFVAFDFEKSEAELQKITDKFQDDVSALGYRVATGICHSTDLHRDILEVIKSAEAVMYKNKEEYYSNIGKEHR